MQRPQPAEDLVSSLHLDHSWERLGWLVQLRWIAIVTVAAVVATAWATHAVETIVPLILVVVLLFAANVAFARWRRVDRRPGGPEALERHAVLQIGVDLGALTALLHWSDGAENPFVMLFALHAAIAAKLLRPGPAFALAGAALVLQGGVVAGEHYGLLVHHRLLFAGEEPSADAFIESQLYLVGYIVALAFMLFGTTYFVSSMAGRFRDELAERVRMEAVAVSRERLAYVGELSAGVAHSIRNPLHGVLNCVEILRSQVDDQPNSAETLGLMEEGLRRIETLTHRLLTLTRDSPLHLRSTNLTELVEAASRFVRTGPALDVSGQAVVAEVDPDRMCEALTNVLDNALHACRDGGRVSVRISAGPGDLVMIEVRDTGEGIRPEALLRVFDPFFTTKAVGEGTGLGLAITRRILEDHGGAVEVESSGAGTTVRLVFPRLAQDVRRISG